MSANPVLPPVLFNRPCPDSGKLLPDFANRAGGANLHQKGKGWHFSVSTYQVSIINSASIGHSDGDSLAVP